MNYIISIVDTEYDVNRIPIGIELISKMSANFIQNMFKEHKDIIQPLLTNHLRDKFEEKFKTIKFT